MCHRMTTEAALGCDGRVLEMEHAFLAGSDAALGGTVSEQPPLELAPEVSCPSSAPHGLTLILALNYRIAMKRLQNCLLPRR